MRQLRLVVAGDISRHYDDRRVDMQRLPHWGYVEPIVQRLPIEPSIVRLLASGVFEEYDLKLLAKIVTDHAAFRITATIETYTDVRDATIHVSFKFSFEAFSPEVAKTSLKAAELAEERKAAGTKRAQLRRSISGS